jgi:hypothetical protein
MRNIAVALFRVKVANRASEASLESIEDEIQMEDRPRIARMTRID